MQVTCLNCRMRHSKCERAISPRARTGSLADRACARCTTLGEKCVPGTTVRFKHSSGALSAARNQHWVKYPRRVRFVDETDSLEALYNEDVTISVPSVTEQDAWTSPTNEWQEAQAVNFKRPANTTRTKYAPQNEKKSSSPIPFDERSLSTLPAGSRLSFHRPTTSHESTSFPLQNPREVRLLKYYLEYMCTWFDLCDTSRHFAREIPKRAISSPILLNAIFAISSRHLSMKEQFDEYASTRYHQHCLKQLSSLSNESFALESDDLLAAIILLRTLEELDGKLPRYYAGHVPLLGTDYGGHLWGIQAFMNTPDPSIVASNLRKAAFWVGLRQEVTMAIASQRSIKISLGHCFIDQTFTEADDDMWANRIIVHCANVVKFCFGNGDHKTGEYQTLKDYDDGWLRSRPASFLPLSFIQADPSRGEVFPQILYLNQAVVIGIVHAMLARALLMCYDPTLPKIGPARTTAQVSCEEEIKDEIRQLCGVALSNRGTIPAMFTASLGVASFGDRFTQDVERKALLDVIVKTEAEHYWPTSCTVDIIPSTMN
ncbi:hypothetical protein G7046_g739 [Stylonectria norvegica]|nr:hypothetical protein G7046_g739 [Stylonectria norvegica]